MNILSDKMIVGRIVVVVISLLLFALACYFPVIYNVEKSQFDWDKSCPGWICLLFGWIELFLVKGFSKIFYLSWLANLTYGVAIHIYVAGKNYVLYILIISSIVLALIPLFFKDIPFVDPERGNVSPIENFHLYVGYYFWISSFVVLLLGEFMLAVIHKNSTIIRL